MTPEIDPRTELVDHRASVPFYLVHLIALAVPFVYGVSWAALAWVVGMYYLRMFGLTAGYHRYFSHRSFKTSRAFQFVLALIGTCAVQKGVLWWASHHRHHHKFSDQPDDVHSPKKGLWWSHAGWILCKRFDGMRSELIRDMSSYPELRWLNDNHLIIDVLFATGLFLAFGWTALLYGFFVSTAVLWHGTFTINSLAHTFGRRRYPTTDTSRNSFLLSLITMGEGWHNNHHYYQLSVRQGFYWWEIDMSWYVLRALAAVGIVWDLKAVPRHVRDRREPLPEAEALAAAA